MVRLIRILFGIVSITNFPLQIRPFGWALSTAAGGGVRRAQRSVVALFGSGRGVESAVKGGTLCDSLVGVVWVGIMGANVNGGGTGE